LAVLFWVLLMLLPDFPGVPENCYTSGVVATCWMGAFSNGDAAEHHSMLEIRMSRNCTGKIEQDAEVQEAQSGEQMQRPCRWPASEAFWHASHCSTTTHLQSPSGRVIEHCCKILPSAKGNKMTFKHRLIADMTRLGQWQIHAQSRCGRAAIE